jgi:hypothetical protein
MTTNGTARTLESFEDVEAEFRAIRVEMANVDGEIVQAIGKLAAEVSGVRREVGEVKRAIVEGGFQSRATEDTGSHDLRETYHRLKALADDPVNPLRPGDVRNIVADVTEEMRLRSEVGTWRKIKAFPMWAARKALEKGLEWAIVAGLVATATYLWTLLHR